MNTAKIYHDSEGNMKNIHQMIKDEPEWAANRLQEGEKAILKMEKLEKQFDETSLLIDELYTSGCLDLEREQLVQKWMCA